MRLLQGLGSLFALINIVLIIWGVYIMYLMTVALKIYIGKNSAYQPKTPRNKETRSPEKIEEKTDSAPSEE